MVQDSVLIVTDEVDISSVVIAKYLHKYGDKFKFITPSSHENINEICDLLKYSKSIMLRRGNFPKRNYERPELSSETKVLNDFLHFIFESKPNSIGKLRAEYEHNKLIDLWIAEKNGLTIPDSILITNRKELDAKLSAKEGKNYITKSLKNALKIKVDDFIFYSGYTIEVKQDQLPKGLNTFYPSLLQEKIEKKYEIRTFYLKGELYSMAIFSQTNNKTSLDYRNYDKERPNRCVPYKLPDDIENCIRKFMSAINLNCGSLDFMVTIDSKYYFLEVNPVGQFGWLSQNCNYYLEEKLAQKLTEKE